MKSMWRRSGALVAPLVVLALGVSSEGAVAATSSRVVASPSAVVSSIVTGATPAAAAISNYLFCTTATCKTQRSANSKKAMSGLSTLVGESTRARTVKTGTFVPALKIFASDVGLVFNAYRTFTTTTLSIQQTQAIGELFYGLAELRSDVSDLAARQHGSRASFVQWAYGISATLYTMRIDSSSITSSTATSGSAIYANNAIEQEASSLLAHLAGPNASFNGALSTYARHQITLSVNENDFISGVKPSITKTQLADLNVTTTHEFNALVAQMTKLAQAKK